MLVSFLVAALVSSAEGGGDSRPPLELMDLRPGETTVAQATAIVEPRGARIKCKERSKEALLKCRTKKEQDTLTFAGFKSKVAFEAPLGNGDQAQISAATITLREKSLRPIPETARSIVGALTAKYGEPDASQSCAPSEDATWLNDETRVNRSCATWREENGIHLDVIYRVQKDVLQALGGSSNSRPSADHFIQIEIRSHAATVGDL